MTNIATCKSTAVELSQLVAGNSVVRVDTIEVAVPLNYDAYKERVVGWADMFGVELTIGQVTLSSEWEFPAEEFDTMDWLLSGAADENMNIDTKHALSVLVYPCTQSGILCNLEICAYCDGTGRKLRTLLPPAHSRRHKWYITCQRTIPPNLT